MKSISLSRTLCFCLVLAVAIAFCHGLPSPAQAKDAAKKDPLSLVTKGFLVTTEMSKGKAVEKTAPLPEKIPPQTLVQYEISGTNASAKKLKDIETVGLIPENTEYVDKSARCDKAGEILFSNDKGATFAKAPLKKTVTGSGGEKKTVDVLPSEYTNVRFTIKQLAPKAGFKTVYRVRVK